MSKKTASYPLLLSSRPRDIPAYQWLYEAIRSEILSGRLRSGSRLPASRELARQWGLARGTIVSAFDQLASEGYIESRAGSGTYVRKVLPERLLQVPSRPGTNARRAVKMQTSVSDYGQRVTLFPGYENRPTRAFRPNLPALDLFPMMLWTKIVNRCMRRMSTRHLMGCDPLGYIPLREAVADYLCTSRGVKCVPEQVAIVSGVQQALDLTARLMLEPGDQVYVEKLAYTGAVRVFQAYGAKICSVPTDGAGIVIGRPSRAIRLIYVTPGHQFPLGITMRLERRLRLLDWARKSRAAIFEDDYDSEYRYSGRPIPALQGLSDGALVLYAGSFSKVMFPSLRLGYLVIPFELLRQFEASLSLTSRHVPMLEQLALNDFISDGHFGRHLRRMREVYAERLSILTTDAASKLAGLLEISNVEAGLQTVGWLSVGIKAQSAVAAAAKRNVEVVPLHRYSRGMAAPEGLLLGFAPLDGKEIRRGVQELALALEGERKVIHGKSRF